MGICLAGAGRHAEALAAHDRGREVLQAAATANPTLVRLPAASAWIDVLTGESFVTLGRNEEALAAFVRAREARELLIKTDPAATRNRERLIRVLRQVVGILRPNGLMSEVLAPHERVREVAEGLTHDHPQDRAYRQDLVLA